MNNVILVLMSSVIRKFCTLAEPTLSYEVKYWDNVTAYPERKRLFDKLTGFCETTSEC